MGRKVRSYTQEYKNTIVDLFNSGNTYAELSDKYGVPKTTIIQWVNKVNNTDDNNISNEDNSPMESFHSCFKKEDERMNKYFDFNDAKTSTFQYIESWYNRKRIHSRVGFMTPQAYEDLILKST